MVRDFKSSTQVVCKAQLKDRYFDILGAHLYLSFSLLLPIITMLILVAFMRSAHDRIFHKLTANHPSFAALAVIGTYLVLYIWSVDFAATILIAKHSYSGDIDYMSFNLFIVFFTMFLDGIAVLYFIICMLYLCCTQLHKDSCCTTIYNKALFTIKVSNYLYAIFLCHIWE